jgi:hypothetical protein
MPGIYRFKLLASKTWMAGTSPAMTGLDVLCHPVCGARHMSLYDADDLTTVIEQDGRDFVVLQSPRIAEHCADYRELGRFCDPEES